MDIALSNHCAHRRTAMRCIALVPLLLLLAVLWAALGARAAVAAPVQQQPAPGIAVSVGVATTPQVDPCEPATAISVQAGTTIYTCYTVTNTTSSATPITITQVIIAQTTDGTGPNPDTQVLATSIPVGERKVFPMPGFVPQGQVVHVTADIAANGGPNTGQQQVSKSVTVTIVNPALTVAQTLGTTADGCTDATSIAAPKDTTIYRCITLTNTGDVDLAKHSLTLTNTPPGSPVTTPFTHTLAVGGVLKLTSANAHGLPDTIFALKPTITTTLALSVTSTATEPYTFTSKPAGAPAASITVGTAATSLVGVLNTSETCGSTTSTSLAVVTNSSVYNCLRLTNTGTVALTRHVITMTGQNSITLDAPVAPNSTLVITNSTLTALNLPPILGPIVATANVNTSFAVSSTAGLFKAVSTATTVILASTPTATPSPTPTLVPTITPFPSWTPSPVPPTWTPWPTWTPIDTPVPPSPTWTRSYELSYLQTPTPRSDMGQAAPAADGSVYQDPNAYLTPNAGQPPFDSGLPTPFLDPNNPEAVGAAPPLPDTDTPTPPFTDTPTLEPTRTPLPTMTPTPTPTPTSTQRPIVYAAPAPPAGFAGTFAGVLDSTIAAAGILFVATGAVVFFGVLATLLALGFLRSSRRPYELREADGDDADFMAAKPGAGQAGGAPGDHWPTSLP